MKFSIGWFNGKFKQIVAMQMGYSMVLTPTKGYKPNGQRKKLQRLNSLYELAEQKKMPKKFLKEVREYYIQLA